MGGVREGEGQKNNPQGFHYLIKQKQLGKSWRNQISDLNSSKRNVTQQEISVLSPLKQLSRPLNL